MSIFEPYSDDFDEALIPIEEEEDKSDYDPKFEYEVQEFLKVGLFCGMTPMEFMDTPLAWRDALSKEIDKRLKPYMEMLSSQAAKGGKTGKPKLPLNFFHLSILLALSTMMGSEE